MIIAALAAVARIFDGEKEPELIALWPVTELAASR
jgi:hypothetical protein